MHAPRFLFPSEYTCARQVEMEEEESGGEEDAGPCEVFGLLRLPLKPGTASGYVGVQRIASKKRPWQATLKPPRVASGSMQARGGGRVQNVDLRDAGPTKPSNNLKMKSNTIMSAPLHTARVMRCVAYA